VAEEVHGQSADDHVTRAALVEFAGEMDEIG